jgi:low temperature requirement protein LtrA
MPVQYRGRVQPKPGAEPLGDEPKSGADPTPEKRVTWAELFFDLVFVFAVTQVSTLLHHDSSGAGVARALIVFVPVWWAWVGTTIFANRHEVEIPRETIGIFTVGLGSLCMALAIPQAYAGRGLLFGAAYLFLRLVLGVLVFRNWRGIRWNSFSVGVLVTGPLLLAGGLVHGAPRIILWSLAAITDLVTPRLLRNRLAVLRFDTGHLPERFGTFLLIALGESVVQIGVSASDGALSPARLVATVAAYVLACSLWWVYFVFAARAVRHAMAEARVHTDVIRPVFSYGHLLFISAIIAVAVGMAEVVAAAGTHPHRGPAALLVGGCALYLATFGYTRWRMFRMVSWTRLGAAVACLAVLPFATRMPALALLLVLVVVTVALNVVEAAIVRRQGSLPGRVPQRPEPGAEDGRLALSE